MIRQVTNSFVMAHHCCELPLVAQTLKSLPAVQEILVWSLGWETPLEKGMAIHSSILAWRLPWMEKPGRLQSTGSKRVRHNWATLLSLSFFLFIVAHSYTSALLFLTSICRLLKPGVNIGSKQVLPLFCCHPHPLLQKLPSSLLLPCSL